MDEKKIANDDLLCYNEEGSWLEGEKLIRIIDSSK